MTRAELDTLMTGTGIYFDPDHPDHIERQKITTLPPPFMTFSVRRQDLYADDVSYYGWLRLTVRIYSDIDADPAEETVRAALVAAGINTQTTKRYYDELGLWAATLTGDFPGE